MTDPDLAAQILEAFDVPPEWHDWVTGEMPDPWRLSEERYVASLPRRMGRAAEAANARYAHLLPDGVRFEWGPAE